MRISVSVLREFRDAINGKPEWPAECFIEALTNSLRAYVNAPGPVQFIPSDRHGLVGVGSESWLLTVEMVEDCLSARG